MVNMDKIELKGMDISELVTLVHSLGEKPYRARQLAKWIYQKGCPDIGDFSDLSKEFRGKLVEICRLSSLKLIDRKVSVDGTAKYLFELNDGERIESVLVDHPRGPAICISTQVGCGQGCVFCLSGKGGLRRNLTTGEIIDQVITLSGDIAEGTSWSVVVMGMGEPLDNYQRTLKAIKLMVDGAGLGLSPRRVTLSTVGLVPELRELAEEGLRINLAVSLMAPDDETRNRFIPANRDTGIKRLLEACRAFPLDRRGKLTFEYVMLAGVNDSPGQARLLGKLLRPLRCRVNLIPFNSFPGSPFSPPSRGKVLAFQKHLSAEGLKATIRESRGGDIGAACGQLTH